MGINKIEISTQAILVKQRPQIFNTKQDDYSFEKLHDFFIFTLQSNELLQAAKFLGRHESSRGIQRKHKEDRDKQIGSFICSEHPFFPNTIIINIPMEFEDSFYNVETMKLSFEIEKKTAYIIDGQHRLKAFQSPHSQKVNLPLVVAAYFGLELPSIAEIFTRINFFQSPVSKSVVYDLLEFNKDRDFQKFIDAHQICEELNSTINSPFYNLIKMLGIGSGLLSQAAFVEAITTRYKIMPILKEHMSIDDISKLISSYFNAIKKSFHDNKWGNKDSILSRTVGFNALVSILRDLIQSNPGKAPEKYDFSKYADAMAKIDVDSEEIRSFGGFKGVNTLASKFKERLKMEGLL